MDTILNIKAREVLDSRGNPTVEAEVHTPHGTFSAMVPSGASTGKHEAVELRDGGKRYLGKGVQSAVDNINTIISPKLRGHDLDIDTIDEVMLKLDGTKNKRKLGANALLAVSMACCRAAANKTPLYKYLSDYFKLDMRLPVPFSNVINGGKHADGDLYMQEFMIVPMRARSFSQATRMVSETYHKLKIIIRKEYGGGATHVGDEGGFAPPLSTPEEALDLLMRAIDEAGYATKMKIAMDPAASEFFKDNKYHGMKKADMIKKYKSILKKYPIVSLEDPFAEDDYSSWARLSRMTKVQIVGDDLTVTNTERIKVAAKKKLCSALLLKVNQIGTVSEAVQAAKLAYQKNWEVMVSHRSGETEDPFIADLAVAIGCGQIKIGAPCRSDRTAKYNKLIRIEDESRIPYGLRR